MGLPVREPIIKQGESPSLQELTDWLRKLEINIANKRAHQLLAALEDDEQNRKVRWKDKTVPLNDVTFGELGTALIELRDLTEIYYAFQTDKTELFKRKLAASLAGLLTIAEETPANNAARNTMFELTLAAHWRLLGLDVALSDPDIILQLGDVSFYVECKRPFWDHSVRPNLREAVRQLERKLSQPDATAKFGLVALSVTRILNRESRYARLSHSRDMGSLFGELDSFWKEHRLHLPSDCKPTIVAVVLHYAVPVVIGDEPLRNVSSQYFGPVGNIGPVFEVLRDTFEPLFKARQEVLFGPQCHPRQE